MRISIDCFNFSTRTVLFFVSAHTLRAPLISASSTDVENHGAQIYLPERASARAWSDLLPCTKRKGRWESCFLFVPCEFWFMRQNFFPSSYPSLFFLLAQPHLSSQPCLLPSHSPRAALLPWPRSRGAETAAASSSSPPPRLLAAARSPPHRLLRSSSSAGASAV